MFNKKAGIKLYNVFIVPQLDKIVLKVIPSIVGRTSIWYTWYILQVLPLAKHVEVCNFYHISFYH